ncbi:MAG: carbohydrate ABC transporter permease [Promethearchaeota archaeon]
MVVTDENMNIKNIKRQSKGKRNKTKTKIKENDEKKKSNVSAEKNKISLKSKISMIGFYLLLIVIAFACVLPILWTYIVAIKQDIYTGEYGTPVPDQIPDNWFSLLPEDWFNFSNFIYVITETNFIQYLLNSLMVSIGTTLIGISVSITAAYAFSRFKFRGKGFMLDSVLITQMFPNILIIIPIFLVWSQLGLLNTIPGLILVYISLAIPFCTWMMKGYFDAIPKDLEEAGMVLGLSRVQAFYKIVIPAVRPGIIATALYTFITAYNEYMVALTFNVLPESQTLPVAINQFFPPYEIPKYTYLAAFGILVSIPIVIIFFILQKHLEKGLLSGAVK